MSSTGQYFQIYDVICANVQVMRSNYYFRILLLTTSKFLLPFIHNSVCHNSTLPTSSYWALRKISHEEQKHTASNLKDKILQYLFPTTRGVDGKTQGRVLRLYVRLGRGAVDKQAENCTRGNTAVSLPSPNVIALSAPNDWLRSFR